MFSSTSLLSFSLLLSTSLLQISAAPFPRIPLNGRGLQVSVHEKPWSNLDSLDSNIIKLDMVNLAQIGNNGNDAAVVVPFVQTGTKTTDHKPLKRAESKNKIVPAAPAAIVDDVIEDSSVGDSLEVEVEVVDTRNASEKYADHLKRVESHREKTAVAVNNLD